MAYIGAGITRFNTADGLTVKGTAEFTDTVVLGDSDELRFGAGEDLKIYHDASNSYIHDAGTGALIIRSNSFQAKSADNTTTMFTGAESGAVELYHNNVKRIETTGSGATVTGTLAITGNLSAPSQIVHTGDSDTFIEFNAADNMRFVTGNTAKINIQASAVVVNEASNDFDFRVESNGNANMLFVDGGNDRVGIGTSSPAAAMHIISGSDNANTLLLADTTVDATIVDGFVTSRHATIAEEPVLMIQGRSTGSENIVLIGGTHNTTTYNTATSIQFYTASSDTSTTPSEAARIDSSGNILHQRTSNTISGTSINKMTLGDGTGQYGVIVDVGSGSGYYGFARGGTYNSRIRYDYTSNFMAFDVNQSERMHIDSSGNVGINTSTFENTNGTELNLKGGTNNSKPAVITLQGAASNGAGYKQTEVFGISGVSSATEITRITGTGSNGMRMLIYVTAVGHTASHANAHTINKYYWDGGTNAPQTISIEASTYGAPGITFDVTTSNRCIIKLTSGNGTGSFNGIMEVQWFVPIDFASSTWQVS